MRSAQPNKKKKEEMFTVYSDEERGEKRNTNIHRRIVNTDIRRENITKESSSTKRDEDDEPDPELLEKYDSFYHTTKSLLVLFQIMGVMPIERPRKGYTTYRYCMVWIISYLSSICLH